MPSEKQYVHAVASEPGEFADVFDLAALPPGKADAALIAADARHLARIGAALRAEVAGVEARLADQKRMPAGRGERALERDLEIQRLSARLRVLRRFGLDACLGRIVGAAAGTPGGDGAGEVSYIGRFGLTDTDGSRLLLDWRAPAAQPFFAATHAQPSGLTSRRRYRWGGGRVVDYWDEVFAADGVDHSAALDDQSAFIASLGTARESRMRDVLSTIQADQDAIIRATSRGALVVDGGPGTGKTVVALHRAAYLLATDPRLRGGTGGVLFVGPHQPYLAYIDDVLPSLGEDGALTCTLRDLVPGGRAAGVETDPVAARVKATARLADAVDPAVALYEEPPASTLRVETPWVDVDVEPAAWADAFGSADPALSHNEARDEVWTHLIDALIERHADDDIAPVALHRALTRDGALQAAFAKAWPLLSPEVVVADLYSVPAYLRRCAPWLTADEIAALQRPDPRAWTDADLPLLDAARRRVGDPAQNRQRRRREAALERRRNEMERVVDELIANDDSENGEVRMLRGADAQVSLVDEAELPSLDVDELAGPFAHIIVDEAQELTDAQWRMLLRRCPSRSFTIVGDRAQARHGFPQSWQERLEGIGFREVALASLTVNYRTPEEIMAAAAPVIRAALPDANVPTSIRRTGIPVRRGAIAELDDVLAAWTTAHVDGVAAVIGRGLPDAGDHGDRVRTLTPELSKGLEFDLVVLIAPASWGGDDPVTLAVDRYVAMTRATRELVILE
ncbi:RNA polymerase recycling motor ATPase HelR [Microbacterium telephonicum]|uniref:DNA helicase IV n=1 Tax=Microbacterium telephonicum TaxID=1714841 RepID=A0A498CA04_9MICO|nr:RNA polymerase recycling motor ATPase HelR [Microbacterium telephonicum]RLK52127.1 DNA helicase IV [Microbacterium telephonicum]